MLPLAPGRLSTTTGWPSRSCSGVATRRARMSVGPPAGSGTIIRIGRVGYGPDCANASIAGNDSATQPAATVARNRRPSGMARTCIP